jgi:general secretion pathway protein G
MIRKPRRESGFTLLEIMVVLVIIAILGALIGPQLLGQVGEARIKATRLDLRNLATALDMYQMDNFRYPTTDQGLQALVQKPGLDPVPRNWRPQGYIRGGALPDDQWDNPYRYRQPGEDGRPYDLYTLGADNQEGGEGEDADFDVWNLN